YRCRISSANDTTGDQTTEARITSDVRQPCEPCCQRQARAEWHCACRAQPAVRRTAEERQGNAKQRCNKDDGGQGLPPRPCPSGRKKLGVTQPQPLPIAQGAIGSGNHGKRKVANGRASRMIEQAVGVEKSV